MSGQTLEDAAKNRPLRLGSGEFWLTTNVEARTGFKGGAGLDKVMAFQLDARFVALLIDVAMKPREAAAVERLFEVVGMNTKVQVGTHAEKGPVMKEGTFKTALAIPRVTFEGGGRGAQPLTGRDFNIGILVTEDVRQWARLFQLCVKQIDHLRYDETKPAGARMVRVKQLFPPVPPSSGGGPSRGGPPNAGSSNGKSTSANAALQRANSNHSIREIMKTQIAPRAHAIARNQNIAGAKGRLLGELGQRVNRSRVEAIIDSKIEQNHEVIGRILDRGQGVLVIVRTEQGAENNNRHTMHTLSSISFQGGSTEENAKASWHGVRRLHAAPSKGSKMLENYMWIPPDPPSR